MSKAKYLIAKAQWEDAAQEINDFVIDQPLEEEKRSYIHEEILSFGQPPLDLPKQWIKLNVDPYLQYCLWCNIADMQKDLVDLKTDWENTLIDFKNGSLWRKFLMLEKANPIFIQTYLGVEWAKNKDLFENFFYKSFTDPEAMAVGIVNTVGVGGFCPFNTKVPKEVICELIKGFSKQSYWSYDWFNFESDIKELLSKSRKDIAQLLWNYKNQGNTEGTGALQLLYGKDVAYEVDEPFVSIRKVLKTFRELPSLKVKALKKVFKVYEKNAMDLATQKGLVSAASVFGGQAEQWIQKNLKAGRSLHDAVYYLLPIDDKKLATLLWDALKRNKPIAECDTICSSWADLSSKDKEKTFEEILLLIQTKIYPSMKHYTFAAEAAKWGISKQDYPQLESRFIRSLTQCDFHPEVKVKLGKLEGFFLKQEDPRGMFLGQYTDCCQHPKSLGRSCAYYGQKNSNSGFFVVLENEQIIAQSWTWETPSGVCFDNVEGKSLGNRSGSVFKVYQEAARQLLEKNNLPAVTVGVQANDLPGLDLLEQGEALSRPKDYEGYTDAVHQKTFISNPNWIGNKIEEVVVFGLRKPDFEVAEDLAKEIYPEGWQFAGSEESDCGFGLWVKEKMVGYATIEYTNSYISDLAVLEEYRKYSFHLLRAVLSFCKKQEESEWTADCRESTSYKLLKVMEKRNIISIKKQEDNEVFLGKDRMFSISFTCC